MKKQASNFIYKSYFLDHHANPGKVDILFELYTIYRKEYAIHMKKYWKQFINNQIKNQTFSHFGSTKEIPTSSLRYIFKPV